MSISTAHAAVMAAERAEYLRTADERMLRHVDRLITWALDRVERVNLAGGGPCPSTVADLVGHLQRLADETIVLPASSREAHEVLLHLTAVLLGLPESDDEEVAWVAQQRSCSIATIGNEMGEVRQSCQL